MHIYEVMMDAGPFKSHTVIAKNEENEKKMIADMFNSYIASCVDFLDSNCI